MDKAGIANALQEISTLLELKDENVFKIRAYSNAARSIEAWGGNMSDLQDEEALAKIPGIEGQGACRNWIAQIPGRIARGISGRDSGIVFDLRSRREKGQGAL
jgi:hypothetical protein